MNNIQIFFKSKPVNIVIINGDPWFRAKEIAEILGYSDTRTIFEKVPPEWKGVHPLPTLGGVQNVLCLSEQGLYLFVSRSDKPAAINFQRWVAGEVIPSIRKTGAYSITKDVSGFMIPQTFSEALRLAADQAETIDKLKPKALFYDKAMNADSWFDMQDVAAIIAEKGLGRNNLFKYLICRKVFINSQTPYRTHIDLGRFKVIEEPYESHGNQLIGRKIVVSQKGIDYIIQLIDRHGTYVWSIPGKVPA